MDKFNLTFNGKVLDGLELSEVKKRFAETLLITDPERVDKFFSGKSVTIRRNLDKEAATAFYTKMYRVGVALTLEPTRPEPPTKVPSPALQHEFRKVRPGSVDQSWPIPASAGKTKKTPTPPINEPGNAVKQAEEAERKRAAEEQSRLREIKSARIEAEKTRRVEREAAIRESQLREAKRKAAEEEAAKAQLEEQHKREEEATRIAAERRAQEALAAKKKAQEEAARIQAEEKRKREEEAARAEAERLEREARAAEKKAQEEAARVQAEEKHKREEEAARIKAEKRRLKAEETARRKAEALAAKKRAAEKAAIARAEEKRKRDEEAAAAKADEAARLAEKKERLLAQEVARREAEQAALREQSAVLEAKKRADEEAEIQAAFDKIARQKADEEAAALLALKLEARKQTKKEEKKLREELAAQKRKNAKEAARAKADEERIEDALRTLAAKRLADDASDNMPAKDSKQRRIEVEEAQSRQHKLALERAAERRQMERQMEKAALERAAAGTARLEELKQASETAPKPPIRAKKQSTKAPAKKTGSTTPKETSSKSVAPKIPTGARRQAGAPNLFNLKPFRNTTEIRQRAATSLQLMKAMYLASVVALLSLLILCARYALVPTPDAGATHADNIITNQQSSLLIAAGNDLFSLDRSGTDSQQYRFADLGLGNGAKILNFDPKGKLIVQDHRSSDADEILNSPRLLRCDLQLPGCEVFSVDVPSGTISDWITDIRTGDSFIAIAQTNSLSRLAQDGGLISQQTIDMWSGVKLTFHEGLLYINSSTNPAIGVFRPDAKGFGEQLDDILLVPQRAQEQGHTRIDDFIWSSDSWWVLMTNPDTQNSAVYRFDVDWKYLSEIEMQANSVPHQLLAWSGKILIVDKTAADIARFNQEGKAEAALTPKALASDIARAQDKLTQSRRLWYACLGFLALVGIVAYFGGRLHQLRALVYGADNVRGAEPIDDKFQSIRWIAPDLRKKAAFKLLVALLATLTIALLGTLIYQHAPINVVAASFIFLCGPGIALTLLALAKPGHIGVLEDSLVLVDHNNNYHIDSGARIHYRSHFILLDDIVVYVGNRLLPEFSPEQLAQSVAPLARTGVKVDRKTILVKLGQSAHPLIRGLIACVACLGAALFCLLLY